MHFLPDGISVAHSGVFISETFNSWPQSKFGGGTLALALAFAAAEFMLGEIACNFGRPDS